MDNVTVLDVAGYVKRAANVDHWDSMKLQKLVYYVQAWHLAWTGRPAFEGPFEAWPNGPVNREVYRVNRYVHAFPENDLPDELREIVDSVVEHYGSRDYRELVELTHLDEPWLEAREGLEPNDESQTQLRPGTMLDFYVSKAIQGFDVPQRVAHVHGADKASVSAAGALVKEQWREGLALLASR
ncbi:Panacea domain-containing protein [Microbacterium sp. cx-59]|uniref:Panacea domain-containing protein n=1 Tax=Microbacterium sp. cx-59 TaxID=2891207 RepID=UPI001E3B5836|nr:type II toxin-antitoxin system antitoxin SocA domain-containing protein [Microbacterium sp. cx-59]MCC4909098.1 DUF4065 domain-containing protein [Microbacterium sp. cx-59]